MCTSEQMSECLLEVQEDIRGPAFLHLSIPLRHSFLLNLKLARQPASPSDPCLSLHAVLGLQA